MALVTWKTDEISRLVGVKTVVQPDGSKKKVRENELVKLEHPIFSSLQITSVELFMDAVREVISAGKEHYTSLRDVVESLNYGALKLVAYKFGSGTAASKLTPIQRKAVRLMREMVAQGTPRETAIQILTLQGIPDAEGELELEDDPTDAPTA